MLSSEITSKTGAAASRRLAKANPMQLLSEMVDGDPTAADERMFKKWWRVVSADDDMLQAVARYAFTNFRTQIERGRNAVRVPPEKPTAAVRAERAAVTKMVSSVRGIILMDLLLPDGKTLRNATFKECSVAGGWFKMLACKGNPSEIVGKVLTEADLQKIGRA